MTLPHRKDLLPKPEPGALQQLACGNCGMMFISLPKPQINGAKLVAVGAAGEPTPPSCPLCSLRAEHTLLQQAFDKVAHTHVPEGEQPPELPGFDVTLHEPPGAPHDGLPTMLGGTMEDDFAGDA